jgi:hypothetical protein
VKIIITEEQFKLLQESDNNFNKTKTLLSSMIDQGMDFEDIERITGLSSDIIILCLKDKKIIDFEKTNKFCDEIYTLLYRYLWRTDFIEKSHNYDDGSKIQLGRDYMSGSLYVNYHNKEGDLLNAYATFIWDGDCEWPLEGEMFKMKGKKEIFSGEQYGNIDYHRYYDEFTEIETLNDIINFFNNHYFELIKSPLDSLISKYLDDYQFDNDED